MPAVGVCPAPKVKLPLFHPWRLDGATTVATVAAARDNVGQAQAFVGHRVVPRCVYTTGATPRWEQTTKQKALVMESDFTREGLGFRILFWGECRPTREPLETAVRVKSMRRPTPRLNFNLAPFISVGRRRSAYPKSPLRRVSLCVVAPKKLRKLRKLRNYSPDIGSSTLDGWFCENHRPKKDFPYRARAHHITEFNRDIGC